MPAVQSDLRNARKLEGAAEEGLIPELFHKPRQLNTGSLVVCEEPCVFMDDCALNQIMNSLYQQSRPIQQGVDGTVCDYRGTQEKCENLLS
ncbi:hypothetical protein MJG53_009887 [Ovis ammon polii x Ovis aries]|uniref:Uncharacterized protein n=2 Tax=Ovis TaxID=9935 RepID=A0A836CZZ0_SHEEP|nr:hypothetical protein JEQ12_002142 [Ovis aries]KAI4581444.1 hypothetical protein MJG53_009887 [Ovis ammon polii x Ovis aries]